MKNKIVYIRVSKKCLKDSSARMNLVSETCAAIHEFLSNGAQMVVDVDPKVSLSETAEVFRVIAEMMDTAANAAKVKDKKDSEDQDPADWWKSGDE